MINHLKSLLKQPDTVLFIGSGVSLWSGLPSWTALLYNLSTFLAERGLENVLVEQEIKKGDLLLAASYGFDLLTPAMTSEFIKRQCLLGVAKPQEIHQLIVNLGPTCFVTTNYDKLIELSLSKWLPDDYYRTVINKQLTEMADITGARSDKFVFKLHGDAETSDSIILTREHYKALNAGGEMNAALETIKTLQVSRPFLYIGFGLKDPDFLLVKDLISNTYKGGERDHYAIMPNISDQEKVFWRKNFGIHLISYPVTKRTDGSSDHSGLLKLLRELQPVSKKRETKESDMVLFLARHGARYSRVDESEVVFPLIASFEEKKGIPLQMMPFISAPISRILNAGPQNLILIGVPGGGKSFSIKQSVVHFAESLWKACLSEKFTGKEVIVPVLLDLKQYNGDLHKLLESTLPPEVDLEKLLSEYNVKIYLDSFNEMPRHYLDENIWLQDFKAFQSKYSSSSYVISSRTTNGLTDLGFPVFQLSLIDRAFISDFVKNKIGENGWMSSEIIEIIRKPFFYKLALSNVIQIRPDSNPSKIYAEFFDNIQRDLRERFFLNINIVNVFKDIGYHILDQGKETFELNVLLAAFQKVIDKGHQSESENSDLIINRLIGKGVLSVMPNKVLSFFHQSITEYLAAAKLATLYQENRQILKEKLSYRIWDHAVFLTISIFADEDIAQQFLNEIIKIDLRLAFSAVAFMEYGVERVVDRLLQEMLVADISFEDKFHFGSQIEFRLPLTERNTGDLKKIIDQVGDEIGARAALRLSKFDNGYTKIDLMNVVADHANDYTFCTTIGRRFRDEKTLTIADWDDLKIAIQNAQAKFVTQDKNYTNGFDSAIGEMIEHFKPQDVYHNLYNDSLSIAEQSLAIQIMCRYLQKNRTNEDLILVLKLLEKGYDKACYTLQSILSYSKDNLDYASVTDTHFDRLLTIMLSGGEISAWALLTIEKIVEHRSEFKAQLYAKGKNTTGVKRIFLMYLSINEGNDLGLFNAFEELAELEQDVLSKEDYSALGHMAVNWTGRTKLFMKLLRLKSKPLAYELVNSVTMGMSGSTIEYSKLDFFPIEWWLQWLDEVHKAYDTSLFQDRMLSLMKRSMNRSDRKNLLRLFNDGTTQYRSTLGRCFLAGESFTYNDYTNESINFMVGDLDHTIISHGNWTPLVDIVNEDFVKERLLPLYPSENKLLNHNLEALLDRLGKKFGRRYVANPKPLVR